MRVKPKHSTLMGSLLDTILKVDFCRSTHFKAAISRIVRCTFVNIIISYLFIKKDVLVHIYYLSARKFKTLVFSYFNAF